MAIQFKKSGKLIAASAIKEVEARLIYTLPEDYKQFLLTTNGGVPETNQFNVHPTKTGSGINKFYGIIGENVEGDLLHEQQLLKERLPDGIIAIADAEGGNLVCLSLRDGDRGTTFFWDHERESEEDTSAALAKLASSFETFLMSLKAFDPQSIQLKPGQVKKAWIDPEFLKTLKDGDSQ